jgi:hypothetical protein
MRRVLLAVGLFIPASVLARDHKLDTSQRAQQEALQLVLPATKAQFRQMQRAYHITHFRIWEDRLKQLREGMTEKEMENTLRAKALSFRTPFNDGWLDYFLLDDAYFAVAVVDKRKRFVYASRPIAIAYDFDFEHRK